MCPSFVLLHIGEDDTAVDPDRPFVCCWCSKRFTRNYHLKNHLKIHETPNPYRCGRCGKGYDHPQSLKRHQVGCNNPVVGVKHCEICNKNYSKDFYSEHVLGAHSGILRYICKFCQKAFRWGPELNRHYENKRCNGEDSDTHSDDEPPSID